MNKTLFLIFHSSLFAVAMGWLEGVVVVYLRTILLRRPDWKTIEITREAATLIMIVVFSIVAGHNRRERFGTFLWVFGIWDITYYVCLRVWTGWPESLMTLDTLFYIPCTWKSPVYTPVLFSLLMMLIAMLLWLNRWTSYVVIGGWWGLGGWTAGLLIGLVSAGMKGLPYSVSAMGMSFCLGLTVAGVGLGSQIGRKNGRILPVWNLAAMTGFGIIGGLFGHLARSMFYASPHSILLPAGTGLILAAIAFIWQHFSGRKEAELPMTL